jgi:3-methyladenine DNA glycosylase AlkC
MEAKRKGARTLKDIPQAILQQLNTGQLETVNLIEWLAIDQQALLIHLLKQTGRSNYGRQVLHDLAALAKQTVNTRNETIGMGLLAATKQHKDNHFFHTLAAHPADMVRCWAAYMAGKDSGLSIPARFKQIRPFAADPHFGVREIAWLAVRDTIIAHTDSCLALLAKWAMDPDENIRRFSSEATRPRGVWCAHIELLKQEPQRALPILTPLYADPSRYVQNSVGNWLNDAAKTQPDFVKRLCQDWRKLSPSEATTYIIKKALRTIEKKATSK